MKANYNITESDYVAALNLSAKFSAETVKVFAALILVALVLAIFGSPMIRGAVLGGIIGGFAVVYLARWVITPWVGRRHYQKYKAIHEPMSVLLRDDGLEFANADGSGFIAWDKIQKWRQNEELVLIYLMPRLYYMVPKSVSTPGFDLNKLTQLLETHVGHET